MSKHTPGPWTTKLMVGDRGCLEIKVRSADQYVADVWETRPKRSQSVANARLIAAAPETKRQRDELLAALRQLLIASGHPSGQIPGWAGRSEAAKIGAREAINNATKEEA